MAINKVEFCGKTLVDLTGTNVTKQQMLNTASALDNTGSKIYGIIPVFSSSAIEVDGRRITIPEGCLRNSATSNYKGSFSVAIPFSSTPAITLTRLDANTARVTVNIDEAGYINDGLAATQTFDVRSLKPADWEVDVLSVAYPVGSVYCSAENVNPGEIFGGEWELVDKLLKRASYDEESNAVLIDANNATLGNVLVTVDGNTMELYTVATPKAALGDSNVTLFTVNLPFVGVSAFDGIKRIIGYADGGNGFSNASVSAVGLVTSTDVVTKTSGGQLTAGQAIVFNAVWTIPMANRMDEFCDRFFWKRTA